MAPGWAALGTGEAGRVDSEGKGEGRGLPLEVTVGYGPDSEGSLSAIHSHPGADSFEQQGGG